MTAAADTRKRSREDGDCEMPLSKRINNLHINNNYYLNNHQSNGHHPHPDAQQIHHPHPDAQQIHHHQEIYNSEYSYRPELNQEENPYYYNKNKLLYELHVERTRRVQ